MGASTFPGGICPSYTARCIRRIIDACRSTKLLAYYMKYFIQTLTAIVIGIGFQLFAVEPSTATAMTEDRAIEVLTKVNSFGFGAKEGQKERESDSAFQAILSNPKAKEKFETVFEKGGTCSKLYALCALHHIDVQAFQKLSKAIKVDEVIRTQFGCVVDESKAKVLLERIDNGDYERVCNVAK